MPAAQALHVAVGSACRRCASFRPPTCLLGNTRCWQRCIRLVALRFGSSPPSPPCVAFSLNSCLKPAVDTYFSRPDCPFTCQRAGLLPVTGGSPNASRVLCSKTNFLGSMRFYGGIHGQGAWNVRQTDTCRAQQGQPVPRAWQGTASRAVHTGFPNPLPLPFPAPVQVLGTPAARPARTCSLKTSFLLGSTGNRTGHTSACARGRRRPGPGSPPPPAYRYATCANLWPPHSFDQTPINSAKMHPRSRFRKGQVQRLLAKPPPCLWCCRQRRSLSNTGSPAA